MMVIQIQCICTYHSHRPSFACMWGTYVSRKDLKLKDCLIMHEWLCARSWCFLRGQKVKIVCWCESATHIYHSCTYAFTLPTTDTDKQTDRHTHLNTKLIVASYAKYVACSGAGCGSYTARVLMHSHHPLQTHRQRDTSQHTTDCGTVHQICCMF